MERLFVNNPCRESTQQKSIAQYSHKARPKAWHLAQYLFVEQAMNADPFIWIDFPLHQT